VKNPNNITVFERHQLRIAKQTLRTPDAVAAVMGGMTKKEANNFIAKIEKRTKNE
jgi:hypothetical protein